MSGQCRVGLTIVLAGISAIIAVVGWLEAGGAMPNLGTNLSALVAALSLAFVVPDLRARERRRLCFLGIAIAILVVAIAMNIPCIGPCK